MFRHWYCKAYDKYASDPAKTLTFDQHLLLAAVAPRKLLIAGFDDPWFDTEGEFLACKAASPVWEFLGKPGLPRVAFPADFDTSAIGPDLGCYRRSQAHGIACFDWLRLMRFAGENKVGISGVPFLSVPLLSCGRDGGQIDTSRRIANTKI